MQTDIVKLIADTATAKTNAQTVVDNLTTLQAALQSTAALVTEGSAPVAAPAPPAAT
jgi:hypothetical protein